MATTLYAPGTIISAWTNDTGSAVSSGDVVEIDGYGYGIAQTDIGSGSTGNVAIDGAHAIAKYATANPLVAGQKCYYHSTNGVLGYQAVGAKFIGYAYAAATATATVAYVILAPFVAGEDQESWTNGTGADVDAGDIVVVDTRGLGIALEDIANTATGPIATGGTATVAKHNVSNAISQGKPVWWDASGEKAYNAAATGYYFLGYAVLAAGATDTTVQVRLAPFAEEEGREITLAATGNQVLAAADFYNRKALRVNCPNTAAHNLTFPPMSTVPKNVLVFIEKTSADAQAVTVAADAGDTMLGSTGTIDAANDRVMMATRTGGPEVLVATIA